MKFREYFHLKMIHDYNFDQFLGAGRPCEIEVQGIGLLKQMGSANIIIIVAVIAACIVALLIVIVVVILICRRRKPNEKCKYKNYVHLPTFFETLFLSDTY